MRKKWWLTFLVIMLSSAVNISYSKMEIQQDSKIAVPSTLGKKEQDQTAIEDKKNEQSTNVEKNTTQASSNPIDMLNSSIVTTQKLLIKDKDRYTQHPEELFQLINHNIIPVVATKVIAEMLIGRERWRKADDTQQQIFIQQLIKMLTYSYATNVAQAGHYKIKLVDFANDSWEKEHLVVVSGSIINLQKDYSSDLRIFLLKDRQRQWKVYDLSVAGVSILDNYKAQFKSEYSKYNSLAEINQSIEKNNVELKNKK